MGPRAATLALTCAVGCLAAAPLLGQPPIPAEGQKSPAELYREARDLIREGRFDVAAERLKEFLAANPTEKDFLDLQRAEPTTFLKLRNVPVWSDNPAANAEAKKTVEEVIRRAEAANAKHYRDPARIARFVRNLGETAEERIYAEQQLRLAGDAAVPVMVEQLRTSSDLPVRVGILGAISRLGVETVPGFLAALDGMSSDLKLGILTALAVRPDVMNLISAAESDFTPQLWYYSASRTDDSRPLREFSVATLEKLAGAGASKRKPEAELVAAAEKFVRHTARFRNPDHVRLWNWDAARLNVVEADATRAQAEEYYAIKYLRWALDVRPNDDAAQQLFIAETVSRGVERARFGDVLAANPRLAALLAAAPSDMLINLLEQALREQQTALALGLTQALAARADKAAATGTAPGKPGVLAKALDYPDPRVQLYAAIGLLRAPVPPTHGKPARVVEVLRRAVAAEPAAPGVKDPARALIADPSDARSDKEASLLRQLGYASERFGSGRDLMRRIARASDYDLLVIDRHVGDPVLEDLLAQMRADLNTARRPILVVASTDKPRPIPLEDMLLRLALLIAVTDTSHVTVPPPFAFDPTRPVADVEAERARIRRLRDTAMLSLYERRFARLARLVDAANLPASKALTARLELRLPQLTLAALAVEYSASADSAPEVDKRLRTYTAMIRARPELTRAVTGVPTNGLGRVIEQLREALDPARGQQFDRMQASIDPDAIALPPDTSRDPVLEEQLAKLVRRYPGVSVIGEPYSLVGFAEDVRGAAQDAAQLPRDPEEKRQSAKVAIDWLRRLAVGEVPGYDVRPAQATLRAALLDDELAPDAIEAVAHIPNAQSQQDLLNFLLNPNKPLPLRLKAGERVVQHIQRYSRLIPANQLDALQKAADEEKDNQIQAEMRVIYHLLVGKPEYLGALMATYPPPFPQPAPPKEAAPAPGEKGKEPAKEKDKEKKPEPEKTG